MRADAIPVPLPPRRKPGGVTMRNDATLQGYPAPKVAEMIEKGYLDTWPFEVTRKGRTMLGR